MTDGSTTSELLDLAYIVACPGHRVKMLDSFQRQFSEEVGFLRLSDLHDLTRRMTSGLIIVRSQVCGSLVWSGGLRSAPCLRQVCIPRDLWDNGLGEAACRFFYKAAPRRAGDLCRVRTRLDVRRQVRINRRLGALLTGVEQGGKRGFPVGLFSLPELERTTQRERESLDLAQVWTDFVSGVGVPLASLAAGEERRLSSVDPS